MMSHEAEHPVLVEAHSRMSSDMSAEVSELQRVYGSISIVRPVADVFLTISGSDSTENSQNGKFLRKWGTVSTDTTSVGSDFSILQFMQNEYCASM